MIFDRTHWKEKRYEFDLVVEQCEGCRRQNKGWPMGTYCYVYRWPKKKWANGACPMATHRTREVVEEAKKANPLKASKKAKKGK